MQSKEVQHITLSNGRKLGYAEYGDPSGKPLFFFHGWPSSRLRTQAMDEAAQEANVRIISTDRPGYGNSDYKHDRTILDWPKDVTELADKLRIDKFAIEGVSGGGPYAAACAYAIPDRITRAGIVVGLAPTYAPDILEDMDWIYRVGWENYSKYPLLATLGAWYQQILTRHFTKATALNFPARADQDAVKAFQGKEELDNKEAFRQGIKGAEKDLLLYTSDWRFELSNIVARTFLWYVCIRDRIVCRSLRSTKCAFYC